MSSRNPGREVLAFWFEEIEAKQWWVKDLKFDAQVRKRFLGVFEQAAAGELYAWRTTPQGRLAEILLLDQFSRNMFRDTPRAFSQDPMALVLAQEAVAASAHEPLPSEQRSFMLMPYMHSESRAIHVEAERLFKAYAPKGNYEYEVKHKEIVDRFGRYPHRNRILGRKSTPKEVEFLKQRGSSF